MRYPRFIAHRCGGALAPENTLAGLRLAARLGYRATEFDVLLTRDGVPVLMHDETLERSTDGSGPIAEWTLDQLRRLDAGARHGRAWAGERVPTLREALACCRELGLWANIEIKPTTGREAETGNAVACALRCEWDGRGVVSSFSEAALAAARGAAPDLPRALLVEAVPDDWRQRIERVGASALHARAQVNAGGRLAQVTATGMLLACYTVNDGAEAERVFAAGAAAIFTDRLDLWSGEHDGA